MMRKNASNDKKKALLEQKEKILQDIKYYNERIRDFPKANSNNDYSGICSSDSEDDFPTTLDIGPSISELRQQECLLRTCLQATQELTSVGVLQSEVNVMVEDPPLEGEKAVTEPGSWREFTAECRIDLVPFSITFYAHQPSRKFAACSFRGLRVLPVKTSNEAELSNSVLSTLTNPSDAIQVLRSYAHAYRSRRTTLARLADKYAANLCMEPLPEGGFVLKCSNLLKMSWRLENQSSPVKPFHHKMNFDLEYMDESYLKIIKQAHRQLSDPSLQTDERTLLLAKIISTCLEAQAPTQELYESMESDHESIKKLEKTVLEDSDDDVTDREEESQAHKRKRDEINALEDTDDKDNESRKRKRDEEVMAPPKSIPKKAKPKGKENMGENRKSVKRGSNVDGGNAKKAKTDVQNRAKNAEDTDVTEMVKQSELGEKNDGNKTKKVAPNQKNTGKAVEKEHNERDAEQVEKKSKITEKTVVNSKNSDAEATKVKKKVTSDVAAVKNIAVRSSTKEPKVSHGAKNSDSNDIAKKITKKITKNEEMKSNVDCNDQEKKKVTNEKNKPGKGGVDPKSVHNAKDAEKIASQNSKTTKLPKHDDKNTKTNQNVVNTEKNTKNYEKTTASSQAKSKTIEKTSKNSEKVKTANPKNSQNTHNTKPNEEDKLKGNSKSSANQELQNNDNKNENSEPPKATKVNSELTKKITNHEPVTAKKNAITGSNNAKNANPEPTNAKSHTNPKSDPQKASKPNDGPKNKNSEDANRANTKNAQSTNSIASENYRIKNIAPKDVANLKKSIKNLVSTKSNNTKIKLKNNHEKSKIVIKNHRNSGGKMLRKSISVSLKPDSTASGKVSKIPQKKLSPAYAAALKENPIRVSPRMMSRFKSTSDSNVQAKIFKPVTNIPRLLKKPSTII